MCRLVPNFILFLLVIQAFSSNCCIEHERDALLEFKAGVGDISNRLASWRGNNCCDWAGIRCSNQTGHVVKLNLRNTHFKYNDIYKVFIYDWNDYSLTGKISHSLLSLSDLKYLDLSYNNFSGNKFPEFISSFEKLECLNLSHTGLSGMIPPQLGNLSRLLYLDIRYDVLSGYILNTQTWWLSNLRSLRLLHMSGVGFKDSSDWVESLNKLPSLEVLVLADNNLTQFSHALTSVNFTSLRVLHLYYQQFYSPIPNWLGSIQSLTDLILENCILVSPYPATLGNLTSLIKLALDSNSLDCMIPPLHSLTELNDLSLSYNNIGGDIRELMGMLSNYTLGKLEYLDISETKLAGTLSGWIGSMTSLRYLNLRSNNLSGMISIDIRNLKNVVQLDLSSNSLKGLLSEAQLTGLLKLKTLELSENNITVFLNRSWTPFQLNRIGLSSCKVGPKFPAWLQRQVEVVYLDLTDTGIDDNIPRWFWSLPSLQSFVLSNNRLRGNLPASLVHMTKLEDMDLSNNRLEGKIPFLPKSLKSLDFSNNSFSGELRKNYNSSYKNKSVLSNKQTSEVVELFPCGSTSLVNLDLSSNNLSGHLPPCWSNISYELNLANNKLSGAQRSYLSCSEQLNVVKLNNNILTGEFPIDLKFCSGLIFLDLGENKYHGEIPVWVGENLLQLTYLRLQSNLFSGNIPSTLTCLEHLQVLDLGDNNLSGPLPKHLDNFTAMGLSSTPLFGITPSESLQTMTKSLNLVYDSNNLYYWKSIDLSNNNLTGEIPQNIVVLTGLLNLNLSHNHLTGEIPFEIGNMTSLESLDLHMNNLSGTIPQSISTLNYLEVLNLSYNNLSGSIPSGHQMQSLDDPSIYIGNPNLCGPPLEKGCERSGNLPKSDDENDSKSKNAGDRDKWLFLFIEFGFVVGFFVVFFILLFQQNWRYTYFKMVDSGFDRLYVLAALATKRLREERT